MTILDFGFLILDFPDPDFQIKNHPSKIENPREDPLDDPELDCPFDDWADLPERYGCFGKFGFGDGVLYGLEGACGMGPCEDEVCTRSRDCAAASDMGEGMEAEVTYLDNQWAGENYALELR